MTDGTHIGQHDMILKLLAQASVERLGAEGWPPGILRFFRPGWRNG